MTILFICIYANLASHIYFLLVDPSKIRPLREILDLGTLRCMEYGIHSSIGDVASATELILYKYFHSERDEGMYN